MLRLANLKTNARLADLGSGDGRIIIAFAQAGAEAHGYEVNPILVWFAKRKIKSLNLEKKAFIHWKSFWKEDFSEFDTVVVYGFPHMMEDLGKKLQKEMQTSTTVLSNIYEFPNWNYEKKENGIRIYKIS